MYGAKVAVYQDRVTTWFLNVAVRATASGPSPEDYVALSVALAYLEGVEQYRRGEATPPRESGAWFKESARRVFPTVPPEALDRLWTAVRNGLFHSGFTKAPTVLSYDHPQALELSGMFLRINPAAFVRAIVADFDLYIRHLRSDSSGELAQHFEQLWDVIWKDT